jgi:sigma-B regulation protein RsbU (phosphoserine phosphatase)
VQLAGEPGPSTFDPREVAREPIRTGGIIGQMVGERQSRLFQDVDWSCDPILGERLAGYRSVMAMPLGSKRIPIDWVLLVKHTPDRFTPEDLEQSMLRTAIIGTLLESQTIAADLEVANERIDEEIRQLARLQRSLLPDPLPKIPGLEIAVSYEPSGRAGGDLYDLFPLDADTEEPRRWCIFIADASGHGAAAAVVMAIVQAILHAHPKDVRLPSELLAYANGHLCSKKLGGFVTAFLGIYEPATRQFAYASAGHPPPLIKRASEAALLDEVASYPLGIDPCNRFKDAMLELSPGETMLMYTDGIPEARSRDGEMFELDRLECALKSAKDGPEVLIGRLRDAVSRFEGGRDQIDDQTMVAIRGV